MQRYATAFVDRYRASTHHAALGGASPAQRHLASRFPKLPRDQGVWATLESAPRGATLRVYAQAPDAPQRTGLATHPFPVREPGVPLAPPFRRQRATPRRT